MFLHVVILPSLYLSLLFSVTFLFWKGAWVRVEATFLGVAVYLLIDNCFLPFRTDRALRFGFLSCIEETRVVFSEVKCLHHLYVLFVYLFINMFIIFFICQFIYLFIYLCVSSFIYSFIMYLFVCLFIYMIVHSFFHLFTNLFMLCIPAFESFLIFI